MVFSIEALFHTVSIMQRFNRWPINLQRLHVRAFMLFQNFTCPLHDQCYLGCFCDYYEFHAVIYIDLCSWRWGYDQFFQGKYLVDGLPHLLENELSNSDCCAHV